MTQIERRTWSPEGRRLVSVPCNLCGARESRALATENGLGVVRCRGCSLVYVTPRPTPEELVRFYADYFPEESEPHWQRLMEPLFQRDALRLEARVGAPRRVLDLGTGFGHFLERMRERGWEVAAVEPSEAASRRLREKNIACYAGRAPQVELPERHFGAVTAFSVLEHVGDPVGVLALAHRALRPGGWLLVRVPNVQLLALFFLARRLEGLGPVRTLVRALRREIMDEANLFHVIDPPGHLFGFSGGTLRRALEQVGFAEVCLLPDPMPRRGTAFNAVVDGCAYAAGRAAAAVSRGRLQLAPNLAALARRPA